MGLYINNKTLSDSACGRCCHRTTFSGDKSLIKKPSSNAERLSSDLGEDRTLDPLIKSQLLYRLSYQVILFFSGLQINEFFLTPEPAISTFCGVC